MGKKKKCTEKVKLFYRGPLTKLTKVANEHEMQTIVCALKDCIPKKDCAFEVINWYGKNLPFRLTVGLSSCLRSLKQKRTKALIYDDVAAPHLTRYLNEFANKANIPIIQAHRLIDMAPELKLKTLLVISLVLITSGQEEVYKIGANPNPKPKPIKEIISSEPLNKLCQLLQTSTNEQSESASIVLKPPVLDKVLSSGKSRAKKEAKKIKKATLV